MISSGAFALMSTRCCALISLAAALGIHGLTLVIGLPLSPLLSGQDPQLLRRLAISAAP
jgi:hypothetical protein